MRPLPECPQCGGRDCPAIVYDVLSFNLGIRRAIKKGRVVLSRETVRRDSPTHRCRDCGHEWQDAASMRRQ